MIYRLAATLSAALLLSGCVRPAQPLDVLRRDNMATDLAAIYSNSDLPAHPLTYRELIDIALQQNLDLRVQAQQARVQEELATGRTLALLPTLDLTADYTERNRHTGGSSQSLTAQAPAPPSIGRERQSQRFSAQVAYNLLTFGMNVVNARQEHWRRDVELLDYERARQDLILQVTEQYWAAIAARHGVREAEQLLAAAKHQEEILERLMERQVLSDFTGLRSQDALLTMRRQLEAHRQQFFEAKLLLSQLMGVAPNSAWELAEVDLQAIDELSLDMSALERTALQQRPDLMSLDIEEQLEVEEVRKATLELLPGVNLFGRYDYDHDRFLVFNDWLTAGASVAWDLFSLPSKWSNRSAAKERQGLAESARIAQAVAVLVQVHLAKLSFDDARAQYQLIAKQHRVRSELSDAYESGRSHGVHDDSDLLHQRVEELFAAVDAIRAYGDAQVALERINHAMGKPLHYQTYYGDVSYE